MNIGNQEKYGNRCPCGGKTGMWTSEIKNNPEIDVHAAGDRFRRAAYPMSMRRETASGALQATRETDCGAVSTRHLRYNVNFHQNPILVFSLIRHSFLLIKINICYNV